MAKWKYNKGQDEDYFRYDKIRRSKDKRKKDSSVKICQGQLFIRPPKMGQTLFTVLHSTILVLPNY